MNNKTAEEIIKPKIFKSYGLLVVHIDDVEDCMEEYASHLKKRIEELEAALQKIQNPIWFFQEECKRGGMILDGAMAVALSKDPVYLQEIARKALNPSTNGKQD